MLNPRSQPIYQESDRLRVGEFVVDVPRREVVAANGHEPTRLTIKSLHVLLALAGQHGKVVSREALLEWVWPDTLPTDDVLTQAIGQLRKAFGDDRESPRYLETISKGGYRLLAPVEWLDSAPPHIPVAAMEENEQPALSVPVAPPPPSRGRKPLWMAVAIAVTLVAFAVIWQITHRASDAAQAAPVADRAATEPALPFVTITSRPGREVDANLSPDGSMVAYAQIDEKGHSTIVLQTTVHVPPRPLTSTPAGYSDTMPVWSPDGRTIAFARFDASSRCQIMLIAASGGNERKIADCFAGSASSYDWTPDGSGLLMGLETKLPGERSSPLRLLDIASGQWKALDYAISEGDIDIDPRYSPDGKWIVFRRAISLSDLWKMPATGGTPQRLTHVKSDIRGWDWLPDGSGLVFSYIGNEIGMFRYDMASGAVTHLKMEGFAVFPDVARNSPVMAFTVDQSTSGIFRLTLPSTPDGKVVKERVFPSSRSDMLPAISPDGRTLAFISDRSSRLELWLGELDKPDSARPVQGIMPIPRHVPVWSEDGSRMLVIAKRDDQQTLHEVEAESGRIHLLPVPAPSPIYAAYTSDPNLLLVGSDSGEGRLRVVLYDRSKTPWREISSLQDVALVRFDAPKDRIYFTRVTKPGIWSASPMLGDLQVLDAYRPRMAKEYKRWAIGPDGVYYMDWSEDCATGWIKMGAPEKQPAYCLDHEVEAWALPPTMDRTGKNIFLTLDVSNNADIGLADISSMTSGTAIAKHAGD
ncbi:winged helix-turn-helix domain-containing protein [Pseudoxanthomonas sacheonensis]|uniref:Tol biopolymer transport system component/DNA-binding winged helix-turn-helix (WHTH) protein n=1 Tax=Pseudoxanthomonas sacheonensis TaxID=443615 RepID=A0ABU1RVP1_9GAMM|nr:winged helix-turn-helix domain-containing protein [Pseudoxanthomonas sacheonensis]MDR6842853.1 Tol biopolymer transport system component/DNA-binding winged helix-turn-helix (wHTH) protein [Pseudoxanthomonas sacheonensis]